MTLTLSAILCLKSFLFLICAADKMIYELHTLREKCPNTEFFLVRIFLYLDWIQENTDQK